MARGRAANTTTCADDSWSVLGSVSVARVIGKRTSARQATIALGLCAATLGVLLFVLAEASHERTLAAAARRSRTYGIASSSATGGGGCHAGGGSGAVPSHWPE